MLHCTVLSLYLSALLTQTAATAHHLLNRPRSREKVVCADQFDYFYLAVFTFWRVMNTKHTLQLFIVAIIYILEQSVCVTCTTLMEQHTSTRPVEAPQLKFGPILQSCIEYVYPVPKLSLLYILFTYDPIHQVHIYCIVHSKWPSFACACSWMQHACNAPTCNHRVSPIKLYMHVYTQIECMYVYPVPSYRSIIYLLYT